MTNFAVFDDGSWRLWMFRMTMMCHVFMYIAAISASAADVTMWGMMDSLEQIGLWVVDELSEEGK